MLIYLYNFKPRPLIATILFSCFLISYKYASYAVSKIYGMSKGYRNLNQIITIKTTDGEYKFAPQHYEETQIFQIKESISVEEQE